MPRTATPTPALQHREGCPESRVESYQAIRPNGREITVVRCLDCAAHDIKNPED